MVVVSCAGHTLIPDWSNSASRLLFAISCSAMNAAKRRLDLLPGRSDEIERTVAEAFAATPAAIETARKFYRQ